MTTNHVLLVFPAQKAEMVEVIQERLAEDFEKGSLRLHTNTVMNEAAARRCLKSSGQQYSTLIVTPDIPKDAKAPHDPRGRSGLDFVARLRAEGVRTPVIIVAEEADPAILSAASQLTPCQPVPCKDAGWEKMLSMTVRNMLGLQQASAHPRGRRYMRPSPAKVDIYMEKDREHLPYRMYGGGLAVDMSTLRVSTDALQRLVKRSCEVPRSPDWQGAMGDIGRELGEQLFKHNSMFAANFQTLAAKCGDENFRIRFVVKRGLHPLAFEALIDNRGHYRMLHCPMYRTVWFDTGFQGSVGPLFWDTEEESQEIRSLIIEADTSGPVPGMKDARGKPLCLERLKNVAGEGEGEGESESEGEGKKVEDVFHQHEKEFRLVETRRMRAARRGTGQYEAVREVLKDGRWDLVHFAGHSHYDDGTGAGHVFFGARNCPEPVRIDEFAQLLREARTRFVYLSSCKSSEAGFAFDLANDGIPAILGYRWDVDDERAEDHAVTFYKKLFEGPRTLEYAFLETRKAMYERYREYRVWAAPLLVVQGGE